MQFYTQNSGIDMDLPYNKRVAQGYKILHKWTLP